MINVTPNHHTRKEPSRLQSIFRHLRRSPALAIGTFGVLVLIILAFLGPEIAPYRYSTMHRGATFSPPFSSPHWLGTDEFGRDVLSRIIYGARYSLAVAFFAALIAIVLGGILGMIAGFYGKVIDNVLSRIADLMLSFPALLLAIVVVAIAGPGLVNATVTIGVVYAPRVLRVVRGTVLAAREEDYVKAARALGGSDVRLLARHILPNIVTTLAVYLSILFAYGLLTEAALSFLGLGVQPPVPSWGVMLRAARPYLDLMPWLSIFPGLAIMFAVLTFNLLADGLKEILDPRLRER
jgi:peptide/nickel transport system permease protein